MLRALAAAAALLVVTWLGAVQLASSAAYGDLAFHPSLPAALHAAAPHALRPLLGGPRARAAAALHGGDADEAQQALAAEPDDAVTADLRGRLAEARGDRTAAVDAYVRAGDVVRAQRLIDALAARDPAAALADQQRLVAALRDDRNATEVTGEAWWRLGQLQAAAGYADARTRAERWHAAEASYERALALAPNEETYLLAAGYQSLANGAFAVSARYYEHAADVVPDSADAYAGIAWTAALAHDCARARAALTRARTLRARTPGNAVRDPLADPIGGPALARCAA